MTFKPNPKPPPRPKKKRKRISPISESKKLDLKLYKQAREEYLNDHVICGRCHVEHVDCVHHRCGRVGSMLYNPRYFMGVCNSCHDYIHDNVAESMEKGWLVTRLGKK